MWPLLLSAFPGGPRFHRHNFHTYPVWDICYQLDRYVISLQPVSIVLLRLTSPPLASRVLPGSGNTASLQYPASAFSDGVGSYSTVSPEPIFKCARLAHQASLSASEFLHPPVYSETVDRPEPAPTFSNPSSTSLPSASLTSSHTPSLAHLAVDDVPEIASLPHSLSSITRTPSSSSHRPHHQASFNLSICSIADRIVLATRHCCSLSWARARLISLV